ncbi:MAG: GTP-binding protein [Methanomassiliicoccales archaeon]|nr:MAG: GTP-binding protein [Methanomassiliicoccales archaeon]
MVKKEVLTTKVCLVGDSSVGKTSLIKKYVFDQFDDRYISTLGTKVTKRELSIPYPNLDLEVEVKLLIFDIIGEKGFRQLLREAYYQGANGLMAVCDVTRGETLDSLDDWIDNAYDVTGNVPLHVMANKIDLKDEVVVSEREINQVSKAFDSPFDFTSAKTGENVEKVFELIAKRLVNKAVTHRYGDE